MNTKLLSKTEYPAYKGLRDRRDMVKYFANIEAENIVKDRVIEPPKPFRVNRDLDSWLRNRDWYHLEKFFKRQTILEL